ncbi:methyltransferase domain-containing protein [Mycolicibacterium goodii]|uniref:Transferase n=1 Tax=Mycolicibacterium goodii TaxID=134601 RepID=A0A0K0X4B4_MYCGD|nr:transferase [Mycolicibacterium goodii]
MNACRGCGKTDLTRVLDLGKVPASDHFPCVSTPVTAEETSHALAMDLCGACGLAQLADDDTVADEPRGVEPQALKDQAAAAVALVDGVGWLRGSTVLEFGSPHGGTWLPWLIDRGFTAVPSHADVVLDCFGIMHEPDQRRAFEERARQIRPGGVMLLQYHSLMTIVREGQWNALRHGHFAYYSLTALTRLLAEVGLRVATAWEFDLYGGTVLVAAVPEDVPGDAVVARILNREDEFGIADPAVVADLQHRADLHVRNLRSWLQAHRSAGRTVFGYGAASRAVALFSRAGLDSRLVAAVADASPAKLGRRMPGTDIPIVSPDELLAANPGSVLLTVPDLLAEVRARYPELDGRWKVDGS